jgi:hypothetical protein
MSGQYQERKEYFKQYKEKNKERSQQKRHDYYEENKDRIKEYTMQLMLSNGNKTIPQWCSMNTDAVSMLKIKKPKLSI